MFNTYFLDVIKSHYIDFAGRATRTQFWLFALFNFIVYIVLYILASKVASFFSILLTIYSLALLLPSLAIAARRLHDIGRSAWWLLLLLVPVIGPIVLLIFYILPSKN